MARTVTVKRKQGYLNLRKEKLEAPSDPDTKMCILRTAPKNLEPYQKCVEALVKDETALEKEAERPNTGRRLLLTDQPGSIEKKYEIAWTVKSEVAVGQEDKTKGAWDAWIQRVTGKPSDLTSPLPTTGTAKDEKILRNGKAHGI
ncbi:MAG: hypothetical protein Q9220_004150 [cf. Caloplaca sp. 1 TL-2023]